MRKTFTLIALVLGTAFAFAQEPVYTATASPDATSLLQTTVTFQEYADSVVIRAFDGKAGNDLVCTWDDTSWNAINGESMPWVYVNNDATYYGGYLYATGGYMGGTWDQTKGSFWIGAYLYRNDDNSAKDWGYIYWTWTADGIQTSVFIPAEEPNNGKMYDLTGRELKVAPTKGVYIQNGKKIIVK